MKLLDRILFVFSRISWAILIVGLSALFLTSWGLMIYFEPDSQISKPGIYWWYFLVTSATVGYGDFSPSTLGGRIVGGMVIIAGIGMFAAVLTKGAEALVDFSQRRRRGMVKLNLADHVVIMGYRPGKTEEIVRELRADPKTSSKRIVLCSATAPENPFVVDHVDFVKGELTSSKVLESASVPKASIVLVHGQTDHHTLAISISATKVISETTHLVAFFRDRENAVLLQSVNPRADTVESLTASLLVQTMQDPGSSKVFQRLASNLDNDATQYRLDLPADVPSTDFWTLFVGFKRVYNATLTAISEHHLAHAAIDVNPTPETRVRGGMSLFYIADHRLNDAEIDWAALTV